MKRFFILFISLFILHIPKIYAQELTAEVRGDSIIYHLTIDYKTVNYTGKNVTAMTINDDIPGPILRFKEGKHAVIKVTNKMDVETSVHWHGLLLPNYMDGVPYLTTPPIRPGKTLTYDFPLIHSGTYWFHSHTGLQEQRGVYGSIIIDPIETDLDYDHDLVLLLSDWTDENPHKVLKNLKRHNEWYGVQIGNAPSIVQAIKSGTLKSQLKMWGMKMPGMHISDIPYDLFLINGAEERVYDQFKAGDKIRVRVINAGASTYFWLNVAGKNLNIVAADGIDVEPVSVPKVLIGLAETYDFIIEIEEGKSIEFQATAQDVTGSTSAFLGSGKKVYAEDISKPDYQEMGARMADMHGDDSHDMGLVADESGTMSKIDHTQMHHEVVDHSTMDHSKMDHSMMNHDMSSDTMKTVMHEGKHAGMKCEQKCMCCEKMMHNEDKEATESHEKMDHSAMDHSKMDHSMMNHDMSSDTMKTVMHEGKHAGMKCEQMCACCQKMMHKEDKEATESHEKMEHSAMDHSKMDHSMMNHDMSSDTMKAVMNESKHAGMKCEQKCMCCQKMMHKEDKEATESHEKMEHSAMDHSKMDHSMMNHDMSSDTMKTVMHEGKHTGMQCEQKCMCYKKMMHKEYKEATESHEKMEHSAMDHSKMDHSMMNHDMSSDTMKAVMNESKHAGMKCEQKCTCCEKMMHKEDKEATESHEKMDHSAMDHSKMNHDMNMASSMEHKNHEDKKNEDMNNEMDHSSHSMNADPTAPMTMWNVGYTNSVLKSKEKTTIHEGDSVRSLTFNLTGNMWRYTWSINGKELSAADKIKIKKGEVVRITLNNTTMMHHPMHLHGHFFRVLNGNGEYAPLKHTVDVPPMSRITIEFAANEEKDWFFHCHILYHMKAGMARIFSYEGSERDQRLAPYPVATLYKTDKAWFTWGTLEGASQYGKLALTSSNTHNQLNFDFEYGWNENYELTADYERYVGEYFRVYSGIKSENEEDNNFDSHEIAARVGLRYLVWYVLDMDFSVDHKLKPELNLNTHLPITQRFMFTAHAELKSNFGIIDKVESTNPIENEFNYTAGFEYLLGPNTSLVGNYNKRFGWGGGLSVRF